MYDNCLMDCHWGTGVSSSVGRNLSACSPSKPAVADQGGEGRFGNYFGETCVVCSAVKFRHQVAPGRAILVSGLPFRISISDTAVEYFL